MTDEPQPQTEVLGALPHRRPQRRSQKRGAPAPPNGGRAPATAGPRQPSGPSDRQKGQAASKATEARRPSTSRPTPNPNRRRSAPSAPRGKEIVGTVVQAAAELAEIGLSASARAMREAVARLPRP